MTTNPYKPGKASLSNDATPDGVFKRNAGCIFYILLFLLGCVAVVALPLLGWLEDRHAPGPKVGANIGLGVMLLAILLLAPLFVALAVIRLARQKK